MRPLIGTPAPAPNGTESTNFHWLGVMTETVPVRLELDVLRLNRLPPVPLNFSAAFCPGVVVVTVTGGPPIAILPETSGATPVRVRSSVNGLPLWDSIRIVYVPVLGRVSGPNRTELPCTCGGWSMFPGTRYRCGPRMEKTESAVVVCGSTWSDTRWPCVPSNSTMARLPPATVICFEVPIDMLV